VTYYLNILQNNKLYYIIMKEIAFVKIFFVQFGKTNAIIPDMFNMLE
jgi:hypothetical protein